jgi:hypothetical protein
MTSLHIDRRPFTHRPLDRSIQEIRLVRIHDLEHSEPVISIKHANIDENPKFKALSYTWGDKTPPHGILVKADGEFETDDTHMTVSPNLYSFLMMLKSNQEWDYATWLWIDQLCINQEDHQERNHQVGLMAQLYSSAEQVIVWLGSADEEFNRYGRSLATTMSQLTDPDYPRDVPSFASSLQRLSQHPYWTRLWVVQEFVLAKDLLLYIGATAIPIPWEPFLIAYNKMTAESLSTLEIVMVSVMSSRGELSWHKFLWTEACHIMFRRQCEDPRDYFYGMLALVRDPLKIEVKYEDGWTVKDVMYEAFRAEYFHWNTHSLVPRVGYSDGTIHFKKLWLEVNMKLALAKSTRRSFNLMDLMRIATDWPEFRTFLHQEIARADAWPAQRKYKVVRALLRSIVSIYIRVLVREKVENIPALYSISRRIDKLIPTILYLP